MVQLNTEYVEVTYWIIFLVNEQVSYIIFSLHLRTVSNGSKMVFLLHNQPHNTAIAVQRDNQSIALKILCINVMLA